MRQSNQLKGLIVTGALIVYGALSGVSGPIALAQTATMEPENTILTRGNAEITAQPDSVSVSIAVETQAATMEQARNLNAQKMQQIMESIKLMKVPHLRLTTQGFNAYPMYSDQPKDNEPPRVVAYRVSNTLSVVIEGGSPDQIGSDASRIVDTATQHGATSVNGFNFYLNNLQAAQTQAIEAAMRNARGQAEALARSAGVTIKGVYSIEGSPQSQVRPMPMMTMKSAEAAQYSPTPVEPGQVTITSDVVVRYRF